MSAALGKGRDAAKPASPPSRQSSRHRIKRSLTGVTSPTKKLHRRPPPDLHRRQDDSKHEGRDRPPFSSSSSSSSLSILAAPMQKSLDVPVSTGTGALMSPAGTRRASVPGQHEELKERKEAGGLLLEQELGKEQASLRTDGLKQSLMDLNSFSATMTKRLDDTYYSVLERMSSLQNTVTALRDLAQSSHDLCETFDKDARDLESDIIRQLSAAGQFEERQRRIAALQKRIYEARDRIAGLASRVDVVQSSVERWEQADKRWQERTRKRLKIIWSATTVLALVVVAFVIGMRYAGRGVGGEAGSRRDWKTTAMSPNVPPWLGFRRNNGSAGEEGEEEEERALALLWKAPIRDAEQLWAFDEL
ncbi:hypothetical protein E4U41_000660 [Claviceps citrina]|nr:hypothetical protein E4U41_000660 [Claviceps citrina]